VLCTHAEKRLGGEGMADPDYVAAWYCDRVVKISATIGALVGFVAGLVLTLFGPVAGALAGGLVGALLGFFLTRGLGAKPK
jgi:hypothetical protein